MRFLPRIWAYLLLLLINGLHVAVSKLVLPSFPFCSFLSKKQEREPRFVYGTFTLTYELANHTPHTKSLKDPLEPSSTSYTTISPTHPTHHKNGLSLPPTKKSHIRNHRPRRAIGPRHARAVQKSSPNATLLCVVSPREEEARPIAVELGVPLFPSVEDMFQGCSERRPPDAAIVCTRRIIRIFCRE